MAVCAGRVGQGRLGGLPPGGNSAPVPRFPDEPIWSSKSSAAIGGAAGREGYAPWTAIPGPVRGVQSVSLRAEAFLPLIFFLVTCFTTLVAGTLQRGISPGAMWANPVLLYEGLPFAGTLMLILGAHELGHYFTSRRWGVNASLPYFIPAPSLLGTFGAVIRIRSVIRNRKALMDIAVAGPLAGMAAALPAAVAGLYLSRIVELDPGAGGSGFGLGTSWLFDALTWLVIGSRADEAVIVLHPAAFAGWCGFFCHFSEPHPCRSARRRAHHLFAVRPVASADIHRGGTRPFGDGLLVARMAYLGNNCVGPRPAPPALGGRMGTAGKDAHRPRVRLYPVDAVDLYFDSARF